MQNENDNIDEIWVDVVGYEGLYQVSNMGQVKSLRDNNGRYREKILKQTKNKGYLYVALCKNGICKSCRIHRLVALAFIENPNNYPTVNHIDENKENNRVDNLEWMNLSQQQRHGTCQQRRVASTDWKARTANTDYKARTAKIDYKAIAEKLSRQVFQYSLDGTLIKIWDSTAECGRNGFHQGAVAACCRGELKTHRGYLWSYHPINKKSS